MEVIDEASLRGSELEQVDYNELQSQFSDPSPDLERFVEGAQQVQVAQEDPVFEDEEGMVLGEDFEIPLDIQDEGRNWTCGWLVKKFRKKYETLECIGGVPMGYPTDRVPANYGPIPPWIAMQSRGGLCTPTPEMMQLVQKLDLIFASMHGREVSHEPLVIETLVNNIRRAYPDVPGDIVLKYSRFRTFMRKRFLSYQLQKAKKEEARLRAVKKAEKEAKKQAAGTSSTSKAKGKAAAKIAMMDEGARNRQRKKAGQNSGRT